jgi:hypothetical protein
MDSPRMTMKLWHLLALVAVVAVGMALWPGLIPLGVAHWIGGFPLEVALEDRSGRSIAAVAVEPIDRVAEAEWFVAHPDNPELHLKEVDWLDDQHFTVWVRSTGVSASGCELSYHQHQALVVLVDYADGTNRLLSIGIPDGRVRRRISVVVPRDGGRPQTTDAADQRAAGR